MESKTIKQGRPRQYTLRPTPGIPDHNVAIATATLHELRERVIDQVCDLPFEALTFRPEGTSISIGALVVHLIWAEAGWIQTVTFCHLPPEFRTDIDEIGSAFPAGQNPPLTSLSAHELVALCRRIEVELTLPALTTMSHGYESIIEQRGMKMTPKGVLLHLIWHWTYHSAQIGLLREQWGSGYTWTFGSLGA